MPILHLFDQLWIFVVCDQARDKGNVSESFASFPLGIKASVIAVRTFLIVLSRPNKTAARINATIIWYGLK
jgi:hypothetical protein